MSLPILLGLLALVPLLSVPLTGFLGRAAGWPIGVIFLGLAGAMGVLIVGVQVSVSMGLLPAL